MRKKYLPFPSTFWILLGILICAINPLSGQSSGDVGSLSDPEFSVDHPFEMNLIFDIKSFIKNKDDEEYMDAKITYYLPDSTLMEKAVSIRSRGNFRKDKCYLPPIKIDFTDTDYGIEAFDYMGKIKMVSLCKQAGMFEQYLIKEYLAYKAYELISDFSLKTYLLKVNFLIIQV